MNSRADTRTAEISYRKRLRALSLCLAICARLQAAPRPRPVVAATGGVVVAN